MNPCCDLPANEQPELDPIPCDPPPTTSLQLAREFMKQAGYTLILSSPDATYEAFDCYVGNLGEIKGLWISKFRRRDYAEVCIEFNSMSLRLIPTVENMATFRRVLAAVVAIVNESEVKQ